MDTAGPASSQVSKLLRAALLAEAAYFVATGLWANVHPRSFEGVSGHKHDYWLARVVGVLVLIIGLVVGRAALRPKLPPDAVALAAASAAGLGAVEGYFAARRQISFVYFIDAVIEAVLVVATVLGWSRSGNRQA